jgi:nitroreductase
VEFNDVIAKRRMVRAFSTDPVDPEAIERILKAANRAPSAGFSQGYALLVLDRPDQLQSFWQLQFDEGDDEKLKARFEPVTRAPVVIVPLSCKDAYLDRYARPDKGWADRDEARWPVPYWDIDTGFMAMLILLAAVDEGLGALFFGLFGPAIGRVRDHFGVPDEYMPIGAVAIGHADPTLDQGGSSKTIKRRDLSDLVHRGRW